MGVAPGAGAGSVHRGAVHPAAAYAAVRADRSSSRCTSRTRVTPAVRAGSVHRNRPNPADPRRASIRVRNSVKWTALTGVTPGTMSGSVNGTDTDVPTVTVNDCEALRPPGSVAVTRIAAVPSLSAVSVTRVPAARTVTTFGADDDTA